MAKKGNEKVKDAPGASKIAPCSCSHDYQDTKNGKGMRIKICNTAGNWSCTVCGRS